VGAEQRWQKSGSVILALGISHFSGLYIEPNREKMHLVQAWRVKLSYRNIAEF
jgi:hypothetical protein